MNQSITFKVLTKLPDQQNISANFEDLEVPNALIINQHRPQPAPSIAPKTTLPETPKKHDHIKSITFEYVELDAAGCGAAAGGRQADEGKVS